MACALSPCAALAGGRVSQQRMGLIWSKGVDAASLCPLVAAHIGDCERLPYESMESLYLLVDLDSSLVD